LLLGQRQDTHLFTNLPAVEYWSLLRYATLFLGNSSSGIMETASFALPTVNIGIRQQGRERARNILDTPPVATSILDAVHKAESSDFRASLEGMTNPYGDGCAAGRIVHVLANIPSRNELLLKLVPQG
jgi:UDP-N-acetylglucosamine 2-epimerase (non-hydrolysing)/GDP/UDP-N,N'-diacetylbacillosamine 2-epimerase (hydrolysing)